MNKNIAPNASRAITNAVPWLIPIASWPSQRKTASRNAQMKDVMPGSIEGGRRCMRSAATLRDQKNSPSRFRFCPPFPLTFPLRVLPSELASIYSRSVLGASRTLTRRRRGSRGANQPCPQFAHFSFSNRTPAIHPTLPGEKKTKSRTSAGPKKFAEPVSLSSTASADLPLPGTAFGFGFDLLALRARRKQHTNVPAERVKRSEKDAAAICGNFFFQHFHSAFSNMWTRLWRGA